MSLKQRVSRLLAAHERWGTEGPVPIFTEPPRWDPCNPHILDTSAVEVVTVGELAVRTLRESAARVERVEALLLKIWGRSMDPVMRFRAEATLAKIAEDINALERDHGPLEASDAE